MKQYNSKHSRTLSARGFYAIMACCGLLIAFSAWVLWESSPERTAEAISDAGSVIAPVEITPPQEPSLDVSAEAQPSAEQTEEAEQTQDETTETAAEQANDAELVSAPVFVRPVSGGMVTPFSGDELLFQPTFGDWRVHTGCDFSAAVGEPVLAITDGTILSVYSDELYGQTVTIEHDADLITTYCGLDEIRVSAGDEVLAGESIGTTAETIAAEEAFGTHIHVEAKRGDTAIDVSELFIDETLE